MDCIEFEDCVGHIPDTKQFMDVRFKRSDANDGYIVYAQDAVDCSPLTKLPTSTINGYPIYPGDIINMAHRADRCSIGDVGTLEFALDRRVQTDFSPGPNQIWKCLIRDEWLDGVIIPYDTSTNSLYCDKVQFLEIVPGYETVLVER